MTNKELLHMLVGYLAGAMIGIPGALLLLTGFHPVLLLILIVGIVIAAANVALSIGE